MLDYPYFKENYKIFAIDVSKQQALNVGRNAIQQINFTEYVDWAGNTTMFFFIIEQARKTGLDFFQGTTKSIANVLKMQFHWKI